MNSGLYYQLMNLPLLQGIGGQDLARIGERVHLEPDDVPASSKPLVRQGQVCSCLVFLVRGSLIRSTQSQCGDYTICEVVQAPAVLEPESLYSLETCYQSTYYAETSASILSISKINIGVMMQMIPVFRINYMNLLSTLLVRQQTLSWQRPEMDLEPRILDFFHSRRHGTKGELRAYIKMTTLAYYLNETRLNVSIVLNSLQDRGVLTLSRGLITFLDKETT